MKTLPRILWMITLLVFTAGCSGYRMVGTSLEEVAPPPHRDVDETAIVRVGDRVRLTLADGQQFEGRVAVISPTEIVLGAEGASPQPRGFSAAQIRTVEMKSGGGTSAGSIIVVAGAVLVVGSIALYSATSDLRNGLMSK